MAKIEELTEAQKAKFPFYVDKWTKIGLDVTLGDKVAAEAAIRKSYQLTKLKEPELVLWVNSPEAALWLCNQLNKKEDWDVEDDNKPADKKKFRELRALEKKAAKMNFDEENLVKYSDDERSFLVSILDGFFVYGQHEAHWLGFYDYFREECKLVEETKPLEGLWEVAKHVNWWIPLENIAIACHKPEVINRNAEGRLHCTTGPALRYRDGCSVYAVNGVRVPKKVVMEPQNLSPQKDILPEQNAEVRRVMIELYGQEKFLMGAGAKEIHRCGTGKDLKILYKLELKDDPEALVMVKMFNSTPEPDGTRKEYFLRVPPTIEKADEAVAWSFGMKASDYEPVEQT